MEPKLQISKSGFGDWMGIFLCEREQCRRQLIENISYNLFDKMINKTDSIKLSVFDIPNIFNQNRENRKVFKHRRIINKNFVEYLKGSVQT